MDRGAWQATVHGVARIGHNLATERKKERKTHSDIFINDLKARFKSQMASTTFKKTHIFCS